MYRKLTNKKVQKKIWIVITLFILPGFLIWGSSVSLKNRQAPFGKIFGKAISETDYLDSVRAVNVQLKMRMGEQFDEFSKFLDFKALAWQRLILLAQARKMRISVKNSEIVDFIQNDPSFSRKGQFDEQTYLTVLNYALNMQPRDYEDMVRGNMMITKLFDAATKDIKITDEEILDAYKKENEKISVSYIAGLPSEYDKSITPTDEELKAYYNTNPTEFKLPLTYNLEYITLDSKEKADIVSVRLDKKESLEKIIADTKDLNLSIKETGFFSVTDPIPGIGWDAQEVYSLLNNAKPQEVFPMQKIDNNFYVFRLKEKKEPYVPAFETVVERVKERFVVVKTKEIAKTKMEQCYSQIQKMSQESQPLDFEKLALTFGLVSRSTDLFKFGSYIENIGASDKFYTAANQLGENKTSEIIEMPTGYYIIRFNSRESIDENKFKEEKEKFSQRLLSQKKQEHFDKYLKDLIRRSQNP